MLPPPTPPPGDSTGLTATPAAHLARMIAERSLSALEVVDARLCRIAEVNGALGALVQVDADRALAAARAAPAALPLRGVPFTVKDNIATAGLAMAIGVPERAGTVPAADATVVAPAQVAGRDPARQEQLPALGAAASTPATPVFPSPAVPHGETTRPGEIDPTGYATPHSLTGWPAATVRCGASADGLPIAVQLVAHPWRDDVALGAALELERALGGWRPPPL